MADALTHDFTLGQTVLRTSKGTLMPERMKIARAKYNRVCQDCRRIIHQGEMHGSRPYTHVCLRCVSANGAKS